MRKILCFLFLPSLLTGQSLENSTTMRETVLTLSSEALEGRLAGAAGEKKTAVFLKESLEQQGIETFFEDYGQLFTFDFTSKENDETKTVSITAQNIVGSIRNDNAQKTVVLGAHYDHLGRNEYGQGRGNIAETDYFPGADDNASGVALLLNIAEELQRNKSKYDFNFIIAFFSGEELGLHGSRVFVEALDGMDLEISAMFNFDMVGRMNEDRKLSIQGVGSGNTFDSLLRLVAAPIDLNLELNKNASGGSDYASFYRDSISVLNFTTGLHDDYHTPQDTEDKINYDGMVEIRSFILELLGVLGNASIEFQEIKTENTRSRSSLEVSLGITPGYGADTGLKVEAVTTGKPADAAGMKKGDLILSIDECNVESIYEYMDCLKPYKANDKAEVRIMRGTEIIFLQVNFK